MNNFFNPLRLLGYWLVSLALAILIVAGWPIAKMEMVYRVNKVKKVRFVVDPKDIARMKPGFNDVIRVSDIKILTPVDSNFGLVIPAIGLNSKVFADVDFGSGEGSGGDGDYEKALAQGVAHAYGSGFPGEKKTVYLFAHSADLGFNFSEINAVFYLLNKLKAGDEVNIFYNGWRYTYQITEKNITSADKTDFLDNTGEERLVLQTCWPPGTQWQRLVIVAKPVYF